MIRPETLKEFAELLRINGDYREVEFATEILDLLALEDEVAEPYSDLCADLEHNAPTDLKDSPSKALERLVNRSDMLGEIETYFENSSIGPGDVDDLTRQVLGEIENIETIMTEHGGWTEGDLQDALFALIERAAPMEYDL